MQHTSLMALLILVRFSSNVIGNLPIIFPYFVKISSNSFFVTCCTGTFPTKTLAFINSMSLILVLLPIGGVLLLGLGDFLRLDELRLLLRLRLITLGDLLGDLLPRLPDRRRESRDFILPLRLLLLRYLGLRLLDLRLGMTRPKRSYRSRDLLRDLLGMLFRSVITSKALKIKAAWKQGKNLKKENHNILTKIVKS